MTAIRSRRYRFLLQWIARLVILAYVFQIGAFDHWHADVAVGEAASATHSAHCHGDASGCADGGGFTGTFVESPLALLAPSAERAEVSLNSISFAQAFIPTPDQPPKAS